MNNQKVPICIILGTKAELIKCMPLMESFQKHKIRYIFIHTGQHPLRKACEDFGVKKPDVTLSPEPEKSSKFNTKQSKAIKWSIGMTLKIRKKLKKLKGLKFVIYHGDTLSTACASFGSSKLLNPFKKYKNVHLEAGLRSVGEVNPLLEPFPEEIIRRIVTFFSDILIAPSEQSKLNLKKYKIKKILQLGNTVLDSVDIAYQMAQKRDLKPFDNKFCLISIHRHENLKSEERMKKIVEILLSLKIPSYFPIHSNTKKQLIKFGLYDKLLENENIKIIEPMDYVSFIYQMSKCSLIICDGGSMQEESLIFQKPCIILRMNTERPEGLKSNFQYLSKLDVKKTKEKIKEYLSEDYKVEDFKNPYGKIGVSKKIVDVLK